MMVPGNIRIFAFESQGVPCLPKVRGCGNMTKFSLVSSLHDRLIALFGLIRRGKNGHERRIEFFAVGRRQGSLAEGSGGLGVKGKYGLGA